MNPINPSKWLLIISCSHRKTSAPGLMPAWDRYQGGCFQTLKAIEIRRGHSDNIDTLIVSAKHGLLRPQDPIAWYDQKMTLARSEEIQPVVEVRLHAQIQVSRYSGCLVFLEDVYRHCIENVVLPQPTVQLSEFTTINLRQLES